MPRSRVVFSASPAVFAAVHSRARTVSGALTRSENAGSGATLARMASADLVQTMENAPLYTDLEVSGDRWRSLFENVPVGATLTGPHGRYVAVNHAFQRMTGYSEAELRSLSPVDITHEDDCPVTEAIIAARAAGAPYPQHIEKRYRRKDGGVIWVNGTPFTPPVVAGEPLFAAILVDITDRKRDEEALRDAQADLAHVMRLTTLGELTASIAHEVNQPLAAVANNAAACLHWLDRETPDLDEARGALEWIIKDVSRAGEVIQCLRALTKKSSPQLTKLDIDEITREVLTLIRGEFQRYGVVLRANLSAGERPVLGDRVQLQQVLLNLIMNGIEAMRAVAEGAKELMVSSTHTNADSVIVAVEDTGVGLDPAVEEYIFDRFFTTKPDGLGMGLSICRSIIEAHGGRLWASPRLPRGAVFQFTVPTLAEGEV